MITPEIPASLLICAQEPAPPAAGVDDAGLALWIVDIRQAGRDCRSKLSGIRVWLGGLAPAGE
ncbi:hypothetical protein L2U69_11740 [Zavarzinia compransoris]|uniref:hypothetical protein n=1 Tax=Zavarzinia marina TaxID=2911065 RepID=UPI001F1AC9C2|nr:hypothetical protein [Zavarzinia marina]MCF4166318.1 hypothetical protein [Zavarzinia marina]